MIWKAYRLSFRLLSPVHIGWRKLGNLQQTRPYITGRSLWGALTARLTRDRSDDSYDYRAIGDRVDNELTFTYFYPSVSSDEVKLWPWGDDWEKFAWTFLGSYASTALEDGHSARAGSLHETEFIAPSTRNKEQVYLVGYIFEKDDKQNIDKLQWRSVLNRLQFGGERSYGWGRVRLKEPPEDVKDNTCFQYKMVYKGNHPQIIVPKDKELLAHTAAEGVNNTGTIEPFLGRGTLSSTGYGASFSTPEICWIPGSKVSQDQDETFQIKAKGIWEPLSIKSDE